MKAENNNIFDNSIRSILENGELDVPEGVWTAIDARLSSMEKKAGLRRKPWIKKMVLATSAVAACTIAILSLQKISPRHSELELVKAEPALASVEKITEASDNSISGQEIRQTGSIKTNKSLVPQNISYESISMTRSDQNAVMDEAAQMEISATDIKNDFQAKEENARNEDSRNITQEKQGQEAHANKTWNEILVEDKPATARKVRTSLVAYGNATSNTNSNKSGAAKPAVRYAGMTGNEKACYVSESTESSYSIPLCFGIGAKLDFNDRWALGLGVNTTILSRSFDGVYMEAGSDGSYSSTSFKGIRNTQVYLGIPLNVFYNIIGKKAINFYVYAGGTVEKCLSNKYLMNDLSSSGIYSPAVSGVQLSAGAGLGVQFNLSNVVGIYIDPSIRYYFDMNQPVSIRTRQPLMAGFEMGLRFNL